MASSVLKEVLAIIREVEECYPMDIDGGVNECLRRLKSSPATWDSLTDVLAERWVRAEFDDARHAQNVRIKKSVGAYGGAPKVIQGSSHSTKAIHVHCLDIRIGSSLLGDILGEDLDKLIADLEAHKNGIQFDIDLLKAARAVTPNGKKVRACWSNKKADQMMAKIAKDLGISKPHGLDLGDGLAEAGC